jgi:hypothetical protein
MTNHMSIHPAAILAASYLAAPKGTSLGRSDVRHGTRAGLVAWTGLAAGAVVAGAMLGLPVQNVDSTECACVGGTASIGGAPRGGEPMRTRQWEFIAGSGGEQCIEGRAASPLICRNSNIPRPVREL